MRLVNNIIGITLLAASLPACIKQVEVETRQEKPILVVEGSITTDTVPYTVKLTYSGPITSSRAIPDEYLEKDATVTISDDQGNATSLAYQGEGVYATTNPGYIGKVGRSYSVTVVLKDGKKYISAPEKIKPPIPISKINVGYVSKFDFNFPSYMTVSVDAQDPAGEDNYYRWTFSTWTTRILPPRSSPTSPSRTTSPATPSTASSARKSST